MIFLDSNVVLDLVEQIGPWSGWSRETIASAGETRFLINAVVLAETAPHFDSAEEQREYMANIDAVVAPIGENAAYAAGLAHQLYRRQGGKQKALVADFLIGAHALALGATLVTRDRGRFGSYFPDLPLITPETHP